MATWGSIRAQVQKRHPAADLDTITDWIGQAYELILSQRDWTGLSGEMTLNTAAIIQTGTVSVTKGSTAIVGAATAWPYTGTGMSIQVSGRNETYAVTVLDATNATLDRPFEGTSNSFAGYRFFQQIYGLPQDVKSVTGIHNPNICWPMEEISYEDVRRRTPVFGEPRWWALAPEVGTEPTVKAVALYYVPQFGTGLRLFYYRSVYGFNGLNTEASPLPWVSSAAIQNYAIAMGHPEGSPASQASMAIAKTFVDAMHNEENRKVPPTKIKVSSRYTRHEGIRRQC